MGGKSTEQPTTKAELDYNARIADAAREWVAAVNAFNGTPVATPEEEAAYDTYVAAKDALRKAVRGERLQGTPDHGGVQQVQHANADWGCDVPSVRQGYRRRVRARSSRRGVERGGVDAWAAVVTHDNSAQNGHGRAKAHGRREGAWVMDLILEWGDGQESISGAAILPPIGEIVYVQRMSADPFSHTTIKLEVKRYASHEFRYGTQCVFIECESLSGGK
jgi:hypothetical protein